ncbi:MAG: glycosyltransferase family 4 protein [Steroidobacteraceae bacterium]|jgi:alpha-1,3-mannosyltransferase
MTVLNVLHVCTDFFPSIGGIQSFVLELAKRSSEVGIRAAILCCDRVRGCPGNLPPVDEVNGIPVRRVPFLDLHFYKPTFFRPSLVRGYDLVHVHGIGAQLDYLSMTKSLHRTPILVSTHGGIFHTPALQRVKQAYFRAIQPMVMANVDLVAACSRSDAKLFSSVSKRVHLVDNAVDVEPYLALRMQHKVDGRCLYVGRLADNKGIESLLKVFAVAKARGAEFLLRLVGPDPLEQTAHYRAIAATLKIGACVEFVGMVDPSQLLAEYEQAAYFVSASRYEGFGISAIEAMAAGCCLILQNNDAFESLFSSDADVKLMNFEEIDSAGAYLAERLKSGPRGAGASGRSRAGIYSWERKILEWSSIYARVAERQTPSGSRLPA